MLWALAVLSSYNAVVLLFDNVYVPLTCMIRMIKICRIESVRAMRISRSVLSMISKMRRMVQNVKMV